MSDPVEQLRKLVALRKEMYRIGITDAIHDQMATIEQSGIWTALLATIDRLQRIESAAKALTDAWRRGDHEQVIIGAVEKLTREVQSCDRPTT